MSFGLKLLVALSIIAFSQNVYSQTVLQDCVLPKTLQINQQISFSKACTLSMLQMEKEKFILLKPVEARKGVSDYPPIRHIGQPHLGIILEVSADGTVISIKKMEPWKSKEPLLSFSELILQEFSSKKTEKKDQK